MTDVPAEEMAYSLEEILAEYGGSLEQKLFREVKANWKQFLSILFIGGIAVTLFVGLEANADSIASRVNETYTRGNMADIWVTTSSYVEEDEAVHLLRALR